MSLKIKFWGVRGIIACATPNHMKYGGNTSCIEVQAGNHCFVLDAGTGIRNFGVSLMKDGGNDIAYVEGVAPADAVAKMEEVRAAIKAGEFDVPRNFDEPA